MEEEVEEEVEEEEEVVDAACAFTHGFFAMLNGLRGLYWNTFTGYPNL